MTYWQQQALPDIHDLDQVGLTLVRRGGSYFVGGIVRKDDLGANDNPTVEGVQTGDELIAIDDLFVKGAAKDVVLSALHGKPGERRTLIVERSGVQHNADGMILGLN
jgi:hypothetical protein